MTLRPAPRPREIHFLWQSGRSHSPLTERTIAITTQVAHEVTHELDDSGATTTP